MASSDLLTRIRAELDARLRELRPLVAEYERLLNAQAALGAGGAKASAPRAPAFTPIPRRGRPSGRPRIARTVAIEHAPKRAPKPKRAQRGAAATAILAALEHGSHTVSELGVVTALSGPIIHNNLGRLRDGGMVIRTKRTGDGRSAYALAAQPA